MKSFLLAAVASVALLLGSCGGGTSGTGVRLLTGGVMDLDGAPIADVIVFVDGETVSTDAAGGFSATVPCSTDPVTVVVEAPDGRVAVTVDTEFGLREGATATAVGSDVEVTLTVSGLCTSDEE